MRMPWKKDLPDGYYQEPKTKRPRETLKQAAEKIYIKQLKKTQDIDMAEKVLGVNRPEPKTISDFLREMKDYRAAMKEAGLEGDNKGSLLVQILEALPAVPEILSQIAKVRPQSTAVPPVIKTDFRPQIEERPIVRLDPAKSKEQPTASITEMLNMLDWSPDEVVKELVTRYYQQDEQAALWLGILGGKSYDEIIALLEPLGANADYAPYVEQLMSEDRREWLERLLLLAKTAYLTIKQG